VAASMMQISVFGQDDDAGSGVGSAVTDGVHLAAQGRALGVRAHDADRGDEDAERAGAVVAVERGDVEVDAVGAADRERVRQLLSRVEQIKRCVVLPGSWEPASAELAACMKM
jgi:hypothetical protein